MRREDHDRIMKETFQRYTKEITALNTDVAGLRESLRTSSLHNINGDDVPELNIRELAHLAIRNGLAKHAVYRYGDVALLKLFMTDHAYDTWARLNTAFTIYAFHA